jgi:hypothetical protein
LWEFLDEELYTMTQMNELTKKMQETVHRVNELLKQKGEEGVGYPCGYREMVAVMEIGREKEEQGEEGVGKGNERAEDARDVASGYS